MSTTILAVALAAGLTLAFGLAAASHAQRERRAQFIRKYRFPQSLRRRIAAMHPAWGGGELDKVFAGLRQYFLACLDARRHGIARHVGMPSKAVDEAWHEFILMTRDYRRFCEEAFGGYLHHTPEERMDEPMGDALANTLHLVRRAQPEAAALLGAVPLIFGIDRELALAGGYCHDAKTIAGLEERRRLLRQRRNSDAGASFSAETGGGCAGSCGGGCGGGCG